MAILELLPEDSSYTQQDDPNSYVSVRHNGAAGRYSKGIVGPKLFMCRWALNSADYVLWLDFFRARERYCDSFQISLISIEGFPIPHIAKFVFNSFSIVEQSGDMIVVSCNLLASPGEMPNNTFIRLLEDGTPRITEDGTHYRILE